jgi:hypothetical protein
MLRNPKSTNEISYFEIPSTALARDLIHARSSTEVDSIACVMLILETTAHRKKLTSHCITYSSVVCPIVTELLLKRDQQV